ncbi:GNAT family N-acetyltransferase [Tenggerimyces flavus]|uniref:GNAT family N-acetyltransferase n=1 Tax=Tenggerimyces flavus TaxID=1708749 RepID=A0ABV7Y8M0_9ACTN|nr:GNAT family N-acetyltransferase [Tenggerimyces flavus]MBM7785628.1 ribosomal protein S18 acetylase RimI-like enzyme [Tenggerimyces flavus]
MSDVTVRRATTADVPGWLDSSAALFAEDAGTRDETMNVRFPHELGVDGYADLLTKPERLVLVADAGGKIVGHLTGVLTEPSAIRPVRIATLSSLYVRPAHRGQHVGAEFVQAFRAWAKEQQADRIAVTAFATNEAAIRFYERQGFAQYTLTLETTP